MYHLSFLGVKNVLLHDKKEHLRQ